MAITSDSKNDRALLVNAKQQAITPSHSSDNFPQEHPMTYYPSTSADQCFQFLLEEHQNKQPPKNFFRNFLKKLFGKV